MLDSLDDIHCLTEAKQKEEVGIKMEMPNCEAEAKKMPMMQIEPDAAFCRIFCLPSFFRISISNLKKNQDSFVSILPKDFNF